MSLEILEEQIAKSLNQSVYFLALFTALSLPDIAGAMSSSDGAASSRKYIRWYEAWVRPRFAENFRSKMVSKGHGDLTAPNNPFTGEACYYYRCAMLHQARPSHGKLGFSKILFIEPGPSAPQVHYTVMNDALCIDLPKFCTEVLQGVSLWRAAEKGTESFQKNIESTINRYPEGLKPYIVGLPVIG